MLGLGELKYMKYHTYLLCMIGIYKIINPKGKIYVGQSVDLVDRQKRYSYNSSTQFQTKLKNSINKYGWKNHIFEIIEECDINKLNERERYWQDYYDCLYNGLNCRLTNTNDKSGRLSEDTKEKIRQYNLNHIVTKETRDKISKANTGRKYGPEVREKVSRNSSRWNAKLTDEQVIHICNMYMNNKSSQEIKKIYPFISDCSLYEIRNKKRYKHITKNYNIINHKITKTNINSKKIYCVEDNRLFDSVKQACEYYHIPYNTLNSNIIKQNIVKQINKRFKYVI
jgi:group I intron endonuclease